MTEPHHGVDASGRWRCSLAARARGDQLAGTAVPASRWFLVGHRGPWERTAAGTDPIPEIAAELGPALDAVGARLQLVRRHGRAVDDGSPQPVFLVDVRAGTVHRATWSEPADLVDLARRLDEPSGLEPHTEPLVLVCAHGKKDKCCAIEGRVVAAVLDDLMPGAVWETTHLGGDRFAGNVAYLPEGSMYGGLDGTSAPRVLLGHVEGQVDLDHWRGRSVWSSPSQVAVADVLRETGGRLADITRVRATDDGLDSWDVSVHLGDAERTRRISRRMGPPRRLTCQVEMKQAAIYEVEPG